MDIPRTTDREKRKADDVHPPVLTHQFIVSVNPSAR